MLVLMMLIVMGATIAALYREGIWGNAIRLVNVVTAALLATNLFEPTAKLLESFGLSSYTYFMDFISLWLLFGVFMVVLRGMTDWLSRVKVQFFGLTDTIGSVVLAIWIGWVIVCFTVMTLHTAPLGRVYMAGGFNPENSGMFLGLGPDRQWLGFTQSVSRGPYARGLSQSEAGSYGNDLPGSEWERDYAVFDRRAEFIPKYATRRAEIEAHANATQSFRVDSPPAAR